jgi:hypothetical protein
VTAECPEIFEIPYSDPNILRSNERCYLKALRHLIDHHSDEEAKKWGYNIDAIKIQAENLINKFK